MSSWGEREGCRCQEPLWLDQLRPEPTSGSLSSCRLSLHHMPYPLRSGLKPSSWKPCQSSRGNEELWRSRNGGMGAREAKAACDPGSLGMVLGNTCWGFWLSSEREGRVMVVMMFLGGVFPFAQLHQDQAVPPEEPAPLGNWWSRLGCWEQGRLPASCRLWHLFFEYSFSVN